LIPINSKILSGTSKNSRKLLKNPEKSNQKIPTQTLKYHPLRYNLIAPPLSKANSNKTSEKNT
jgi:hypothetical protein